jgi:hypothetical protein
MVDRFDKPSGGIAGESCICPVVDDRFPVRPVECANALSLRDPPEQTIPIHHPAPPDEYDVHGVVHAALQIMGDLLRDRIHFIQDP